MKTVSKGPKQMLGIALRTTNENGQAANDIPPFWQRFYQEDILHQIPNRKSDEVYGLYIDYEKDYTKPYTMVIGCEVNDVSTIPKGMVVKNIPASRYIVYTAKGQFPQSLIETWQEIWNSDLKRTYTGDFEVYGDKFFGVESPEVDVYIAIE